MMHNGLQISLNSGHHGVLGYQDLTLDYLMAFVAWDLSLRDLKQITLNGLNHSSFDQDTIKNLK
jgi:adenosine deaminase